MPRPQKARPVLLAAPVLDLPEEDAPGSPPEGLRGAPEGARRAPVVEVMTDDDEFEPEPGGTLVRVVSAAPVVQSQGPTVDPVTAYLSRYVSRNSRLAMASSLSILARLLTGRDTDPREIPWHQLRYFHAQELRSRLVAMYSWASVNRHLLALRGIMKECWRLNLISHEDYERVAQVPSMRSTGQEVGRALSADEVSALFNVCDATAAGKRNAAVLSLTAHAGLRRSEVCGLRVENWDAAQRKLSVLGKGNKWRTVYVGLDAAGRLESWLDLRGRAEGALVTPISKHGGPVLGKPLTSTGLYVLLQSIGKRAGVKDFTPHDLRRTYITRLLDKGADALTVSKLVGHESVQTTMKYDKRGERAKQAVALLNDTE